MTLYWLFLIVPASALVLLFTIYFFNLDMKLIAVIYQLLGSRFDTQKRETRL
jgi:hypothetical protein